jgi:hypothetical protein
LTQYLTTTFGMAERQVRDGLETFLTHPEQGIFRGPYLRIRTPFRTAADAPRHLEWTPAGFTPWVHQVRAFQRLSTWNKEAQPTLMTTGTGSGKIMFDGTQVFRLGRDLVFNVSTENHRMGARWLARHLGDDYTVHVIEIGDNHIDAKILPLRPGTLLVRDCVELDQLPPARLR